ncbi:hypothetical protein NDU88_000435 [Pleurodeles waltl]|uniref:Uncharacterized protein n=1 Tax=Pleurodeles waltl TaxID=8319 RepID=A0AAV7VWL4_PLEWA|nr:hypothetical protein NDU88_000435 [Pleurodeles waltl]
MFRVQYERSALFYYTPAEANDWLDTLPQRTGGTPVRPPSQTQKRSGQSARRGKTRKENRDPTAERITVGSDGALQLVDDLLDFQTPLQKAGTDPEIASEDSGSE